MLTEKYSVSIILFRYKGGNSGKDGEGNGTLSQYLPETPMDGGARKVSMGS